MKEKFRNWIKRWGITLWLVVAAVLLATVGSLAAYTNFSSVKRVVSTDKAGDTLFSSNYLSLVPDTQNTKYPTRRVSPSEVKEGDTVTGYTFTVQVCNYAYGNQTSWNTKDITYTFTVKVSSRDGGELPAEVTSIQINKKNSENAEYNQTTDSYTISSTLSKNSANTDSYTITVPEALKDQIKLEIEAKPNETSKKATNSQKLAANITLSTLEPTQDWTGKFIDDNGHAPSAYDAFNYEIYGNGEGTVTVEWPNYLQISPWFVTDVQANLKENKCECTFSVSEDDTAFQLQFYRNPDAPFPSDKNWTDVESWRDLSSAIKVRFSQSTSDNG